MLIVAVILSSWHDCIISSTYGFVDDVMFYVMAHMVRDIGCIDAGAILQQAVLNFQRVN